jgi:hypothetical protein
MSAGSNASESRFVLSRKSDLKLQAAVNDRRNLRVKQIHQAHHEIEKEKREAVERKKQLLDLS